MSNLDHWLELVTTYGIVGGVVLAFTYTIWLVVGGLGTMGGDVPPGTRPQQDMQLVAQHTTPVTAPVTQDVPEGQAAAVTDSAQATSERAPAAETEPSDTGQAEPAAASEPLFIAGTTPWERPPAAPFLVPKPKDASWYTKALTGISKPYPASLRFLDDQGAWYTPFNHPGMTAPYYDIRHWH